MMKIQEEEEEPDKKVDDAETNFKTNTTHKTDAKLLKGLPAKPYSDKDQSIPSVVTPASMPPARGSTENIIEDFEPTKDNVSRSVNSMNTRTEENPTSQHNQ
jgi:hypothetical protein